MSVPFTATFSVGNNQIGTNQGQLPGTDLASEIQQIVNYFSSNTLGVQALKVGDWTTLTIDANSHTYTYNR